MDVYYSQRAFAALLGVNPVALSLRIKLDQVCDPDVIVGSRRGWAHQRMLRYRHHGPDGAASGWWRVPQPRELLSSAQAAQRLGLSPISLKVYANQGLSVPEPVACIESGVLRTDGHGRFYGYDLASVVRYGIAEGHLDGHGRIASLFRDSGGELRKVFVDDDGEVATGAADLDGADRRMRVRRGRGRAVFTSNPNPYQQD